MRESITIARAHGKDDFQIIAQPKSGISQQLNDFLKLLHTRNHPKYAEVQLIQLDGSSAEVRTRTFAKGEIDQPKKAPSVMKSVTNLIIGLIALVGMSANAATWNTPSGNGAISGAGYFSAAGVPFSTIGSVQSNQVYCVLGGAISLGSPLVEQIWVKDDLAAATLDFYVPTNSWTVISNSVATNQIWTSATNNGAGLATNDIIVLQHGDGTSQLLIIGSGTLASGVTETNGNGQNLIKFYNTTTNAVAVGDVLHKMALRQSFTPLTLQNVTNDVPVATSQWFMLSTRAAPLKYYGVLGQPNLIRLTYGAAGSLFVSGTYSRRPGQ